MVKEGFKNTFWNGYRFHWLHVILWRHFFAPPQALIPLGAEIHPVSKKIFLVAQHHRVLPTASCPCYYPWIYSLQASFSSYAVALTPRSSLPAQTWGRNVDGLSVIIRQRYCLNGLWFMSAVIRATHWTKIFCLGKASITASFSRNKHQGRKRNTYITLYYLH